MSDSMFHGSAARLVAAIAVCLAGAGCEALSPQQLWKLNRQPNLERDDAYFSIPAEKPSVDPPGDVVSVLEAPAVRSNRAASLSTSNSDQG
jgi:hypothetical protein